MSKNKRVCLQDVAQAAGVSASTVSAVLNNKYQKIRVSAATRQRILDAARELDYRPNVFAKSLASMTESNVPPIICIFWEAERYHLNMKSFLKGIQRYIEETGHDFEYVICPYSATKLYERERHITSSLYHGMIVVGQADVDNDYLKTINITVPCVFFNRESMGANAVITDNYAIGFMAASCLLRHSPETMVQICSREYIERRESIRRVAFFDACEKAGMDNKRIRSISVEDTPRGGYAAATELWKQGWNKPGLFIASDTILDGVLEFSKEHAILPPRDMLIVAYSAGPFGNSLGPSITTISSPIEKMSYDCIHMIDHMLRGESLGGHIKMHQPVLCYGDSSPVAPVSDQSMKGVVIS